MKTNGSENEMISLALLIADCIQQQNAYAQKNATTHQTTIPNWELLNELKDKIFYANERRLRIKA